MNPANEVVQKMLITNQEKCVRVQAAGLAIDPETEKIYISYWSGNRIIVFNKELEMQKISNNKFVVQRPRGLRFKHGMLYVAESDGNIRHSCIKLFQRDGILLQEFGSWGTHESQFEYSLALDVDIHKNMYICNKNDGNIKVFSKEGKFISKFGKNSLVWPIDVRIYKTLIYVLDYKIPGMFVFDFEHNFVTEFCLPKICMPTYFVINSNGDLIFSLKKCVKLVKLNGQISFLLEYPLHYNGGSKGIEMDNKERIVNVFSASNESFLQVVEDP